MCVEDESTLRLPRVRAVWVRRALNTASPTGPAPAVPGCQGVGKAVRVAALEALHESTAFTRVCVALRAICVCVCVSRIRLRYTNACPLQDSHLQFLAAKERIRQWGWRHWKRCMDQLHLPVCVSDALYRVCVPCVCECVSPCRAPTSSSLPPRS